MIFLLFLTPACFSFIAFCNCSGDALMVFDEMSLKPLQRYWIPLASANFSKGSPSSLVGRDGQPFLDLFRPQLKLRRNEVTSPAAVRFQCAPTSNCLDKNPHRGISSELQ